ncbi:MAG: TRAP transporter large permease [Spirochaetales bacterium]|jgi:tripartite ATP-independent transporter DctM subunit|nr:TRAP transporter large permease [Spirochaetales bacterium]
MELILFLAVFAVLFIVGMPIGFAMIISGVVYAVSAGLDMAFFSLEMFKSVNNFILIAIPMFILTAEVMNASTVADRMFDFANALVGWIPGGMGHTNVLTSVIFAGMSGSAAADVGGIGFLAYRAMIKRGFDKPFSAAVTAASSCIGPIIPPSIPVVVFAMVVPSASIITIFLGGVIPGLIMGLSMMIYIFFIAKKRNYPVEKRPSLKDLLAALRRGILPVLTPLVLLLSISSGMVTISEGAVITVLYACLLGWGIYRVLTWKRFLACCSFVFSSCGTIMIFFAAGKVFSFVLSRARVPDMLAGMFLDVTANPIVILFLINIMFIVLGFFSEALVNIMLFAPMVVPFATAVGIDINVLGVMIVINTVMGAITPPVGTLVYNVAGLTKVPLESVFREAVPFVVGYTLILVLLIFFPGLITMLPSMIL